MMCIIPQDHMDEIMERVMKEDVMSQMMHIYGPANKPFKWPSTSQIVDFTRDEGVIDWVITTDNKLFDHSWWDADYTKDVKEKVEEKKSEKKNDVKFQYFYSKNFKHNKHDGVIVVASHIDADGGLEYGVSFCSPEDQFDKRVGKEIALKRFKEDNFHYINFIRQKSYKMIAFQILIDIFNNVDYPHFAAEIIISNIADITL